MHKLIYLVGLFGIGASVAVILAGPIDQTSSPAFDDVRAEGHVFALGEPILQNGLEITLTQAKFSVARSSLTVEIRYGDYSGDSDKGPAFLDAEAIHFRGVSDVRPVRVTNAGRPNAQTITYLVEAGAPVATDAPVDLTIDDILLWTGQSAHTEYGPWTFQVQPSESTYDTRGEVQDLGLVVEQGSVKVVLDQLWTTPDQTLVVYTISGPPTFLGPAGAPVRILLQDGSLLRGLPLESDREGTGKRVVALSPLPEGTSQLQIEFGPYLVRTTGAPLNIDVAQTSPGLISGVREFVLNEQIGTPAGYAHLAKLTSLDEAFIVDVSDSGTLPETGFAGSPADATLLATDDKGNTYRPVSVAVTFTKDPAGKPSFAAQRYTFAGTLDPTASSLSIDVSSFAQLLDGPWSFSITITK